MVPLIAKEGCVAVKEGVFKQNASPSFGLSCFCVYFRGASGHQ